MSLANPGPDEVTCQVKVFSLIVTKDNGERAQRWDFQLKIRDWNLCAESNQYCRTLEDAVRDVHNLLRRMGMKEERTDIVVESEELIYE